MSNIYNQKINNILEYYKNILNTKTSKIIKNNKECINSNVSFTRDLASNLINRANQRLFNRIFNCSIKKAVKMLEEDPTIISNYLFSIKNNSNNKYYTYPVFKIIRARKELINKNISSLNGKVEYNFNKMLFIFFFYFPIQRNLIFLMENPLNVELTGLNKKKSLTEYACINGKFFIDSICYLDHPLDMDRLTKYLPRIYENCALLDNQHNYNKNIFINKNIIVPNGEKNKKYNKPKHYHFQIQFDKLDIFEDETLEKKGCYINIIFTKKLGRTILAVSRLQNVSNSFNDRLYYLNVMSKILFNLDENKKKNINIEKQKEYIVAFYYLLILLMPFLRGTAAIAEMSLYSLWNYYIGIPLNINQNVLLDVEALTLHFTIFYHNCFNGENRYLLF
jgi:hypothetical protein